MISSITYEHGETTCTARPGEITCRFFSYKTFAGMYRQYCFAFRSYLDYPEGGGLYLRCQACIDHDKEVPAQSDDNGACPQCGEMLVFPRGGIAYCEDCGWPDEDYNDHDKENADGK